MMLKNNILTISGIGLKIFNWLLIHDAEINITFTIVATVSVGTAAILNIKKIFQKNKQ